MLIYECAQGSEDWHLARAGVITASMFSTIRKKVNGLTAQQAIYVTAVRSGADQKEAAERAGYKAAPKAEIIARALDGEKVGEFSEAAKDYAFRLAIERISGKPLDEGFETWQMKRGHDLEPAARMEHEMQSGLIVQRAGFIATDDRLFGASADGLIGNDGGSEYKCFVAPERLRAFWIDNDASDVIEQAQGCMWLAGRKWWHICLYCPALEPVKKQLWWREFKRDDNFIEEMELDLVEFERLVSSNEAKLRSTEIVQQEIAMPYQMIETEQEAAARQQADILQRAAEKPSAAAPLPPLGDTQAAPLPPAAGAVHPIQPLQPAVDTGARIKLGEICSRLGFLVTADFLAARGFPQVGREGAAKLFRAQDFGAICASIVQHVQAVAAEGLREAA